VILKINCLRLEFLAEVLLSGQKSLGLFEESFNLITLIIREVHFKIKIHARSSGCPDTEGDRTGRLITSFQVASCRNFLGQIWQAEVIPQVSLPPAKLIWNANESDHEDSPP
jgi:hypothetical protein